jgi:hypothetical protein
MSALDSYGASVLEGTLATPRISPPPSRGRARERGLQALDLAATVGTRADAASVKGFLPECGQPTLSPTLPLKGEGAEYALRSQ